MSSGRERLEKELMEQAQESIRKMLAALPEAKDLTMSDMERLTGEMGGEVMQQTMQRLSETEQHELGKAVYCEACQTRMQKRGKRKKRVVTVRGEIEVERQYYVCSNCAAGYFPPG
jgi:hypothetical protein